MIIETTAMIIDKPPIVVAGSPSYSEQIAPVKKKTKANIRNKSINLFIKAGDNKKCRQLDTSLV